MQNKATTQRVEVVLMVILTVTALLMGSDILLNSGQTTIPYSEAKLAVREGRVQDLSIGPSSLSGTLKDGTRFQSQRIDEDRDLIASLDAAGVRYDADSLWRSVLYKMIAPMVALMGVLYLVHQHMDHPLKKFGKRGKNLLVAESPSSGFEKVAGCDEAKSELTEIVEFLVNPKKFLDMGASLPRGVLLSGPPGTGKTLLARALAAEAGVPFFSLSGSDFVEMYVGVGAARVRGLFEQARRQAPCIIFIDEIDALGKTREQGSTNSDEREQTLNQLLVELDGFEQDTQVVLIGATNRPGVIDPALLRPGRFDRQVVVDAPDRAGRVAILAVHSRGKKLGPNVSLDQLAQSTAGMSGADLANILNEAALLAARQNLPFICQETLHQAMEKVIAGPVRSNRLLDKALKTRVAYHEVGHALVAYHSPTADPVHKISIVPRGKAALGYTMQIPLGESYLMTETELRERIRVLLGGRAAEALVFGDVSTGAENDLERCTLMARRMAGHFGMGATTGLLHAGADMRSCSPEFASKIDQQAREILDDVFKEAQTILAANREQLEAVAQRLLLTEVMEAEEFESFLVSPSAETTADIHIASPTTDVAGPPATVLAGMGVGVGGAL